jgi:SNF2 family DNA or RNA helicase
MNAVGTSGILKRSVLEDWIQEPCGPSSPNKVLVTSYDVAATGLNFQRANHVVLMESGQDFDVEDQAVGRVNRIGQLFEVKAMRFLDERNLFEVMRKLKNQNSSMLTDADWSGTGSIDWKGLRIEEEDESDLKEDDNADKGGNADSMSVDPQ